MVLHLYYVRETDGRMVIARLRSPFRGGESSWFLYSSMDIFVPASVVLSVIAEYACACVHLDITWTIFVYFWPDAFRWSRYGEDLLGFWTLTQLSRTIGGIRGRRKQASQAFWISLNSGFLDFDAEREQEWSPYVIEWSRSCTEFVTEFRRGGRRQWVSWSAARSVTYVVPGSFGEIIMYCLTAWVLVVAILEPAGGELILDLLICWSC